MKPLTDFDLNCVMYIKLALSCLDGHQYSTVINYIPSFVKRMLYFNNIEFKSIKMYQVNPATPLYEPLMFSVHNNELTLFFDSAMYEEYINVTSAAPTTVRNFDKIVEYTMRGDWTPTPGTLKTLILADHVVSHIINNEIHKLQYHEFTYGFTFATIFDIKTSALGGTQKQITPSTFGFIL